MTRVSGVVITRDEEKNITACLECLRFCDEVVVVDSGSRDGTVPLAKSAGAKVYFKPFEDFASQKNFAISQAGSEWVFLVDADERVSGALAAEVRAVLENPKADGYDLKRINRIFGRRMRGGINAGDKQLRLVRKEKAVFKGLVHERIALEGDAPCLQEPLLHESTPTVKDYMRKLNLYTSLEAKNLDEKETFSERGLRLRPLALFFWRFLFQGGFLDGREGFLFNGLSAYYEFVRRAKHWELRQPGKPSV